MVVLPQVKDFLAQAFECFALRLVQRTSRFAVKAAAGAFLLHPGCPVCIRPGSACQAPLFGEKDYDIVGLYLDPPESAVVLSVDEKSQVQARSRSQPAFPMMSGPPEKHTHDYYRHGTTRLFGALNVADGSVIASTHRRHRATEFKKFLPKIDK